MPLEFDCTDCSQTFDNMEDFHAHTTAKCNICAEPKFPCNRRFQVRYEAIGYKMPAEVLVPTNETYEDFLERLASLSSPVARYFVEGATGGFSRDHGDWQYSIVCGESNIRGERLVRQVDNTWKTFMGDYLKSPLEYWNMICEVFQRNSYVLVWHVSAKSLPSLNPIT